MSTLSTHVLDTAHGTPAAGIAIRLERDGTSLVVGETNREGRCPALAGIFLEPGRYCIVFAVAEYFRRRGVALPDPPFIDRVTIDFGVAEEGAHYHVPLLVSPFAYSTYRGS